MTDAVNAEPTGMESNRSVSVARFATATLVMLVMDRVFALFLVVLMSASYGASRQLDDYLLAGVGPLVIATLLGDLFYSILLPELMLARVRATDSQLAWNLFAWVGVSSILVTGIYALGWTLIVHVAGHGDGTLMMLGLIASLLIVLGGISALGGTVLVSAHRYVASTVRIPLSSLVTLIGFVLAQRLEAGIFGLALSVVSGAFASALLMVALMAGILGRPKVTMSPAAAAGLFRHLGSASLAQIAAGIAALGPILIERVIAFPLGSGVLSALNYGRVLMNPPLLVAQSIATASYPRFVDLQVGRNDDRYRSHWRIVTMVVFFVLPLSTLLCVLAHDLVLVVYHRGAFDDEAVVRTTATATILSAGLVPTAISSVLTRFLYAERAFGRVALAWLTTLVAYAPLALGLGHVMGYIGIAVASSISSMVLTAGLLISLPPAARALQLLPWSSFLRTIVASAAMALVLVAVLALIGESKTLISHLVLGVTLIAFGLTIYVLSSWALRSSELPVTLTIARNLWASAKSRF